MKKRKIKTKMRRETETKGQDKASAERLNSLKALGLALCFLLFACERASRETAEKRPSAGAPSYSVEANAGAMPGVAYVKAVAPKVITGPDGEKLYLANCSACHQAAGQGVPGAFPPLDGSEWVQSDKVERMAAIMIYGLMGPITVKGQSYVNVMAPLGHLKDEELAAIASYIRQSWSNKVAPVTPDVFANVRKKFGARSFMTVAELNN